MTDRTDRSAENMAGTIGAADKRLATLRSKVLVDMLEYWQGLRPDGALPARSDIDPRRIEGALPYAFVLERVAPGVARFRVAGGHLSDLMGMEVRGMPLSTLFEPRDRARLMSLVEQMFTRPCALEFTLGARMPGRAEALEAEMMILPLLDDRNMVTRALGCLVGRGAVPNPPCRFQIAGTRETDISIAPDRTSLRPAPLPKPAIPRAEPLQGGPQSARQPRVTAGFAELSAEYHENGGTTDHAPARQAFRPSGKAPFLRIVK